MTVSNYCTQILTVALITWTGTKWGMLWVLVDSLDFKSENTRSSKMSSPSLSTLS